MMPPTHCPPLPWDNGAFTPERCWPVVLPRPILTLGQKEASALGKFCISPIVGQNHVHCRHLNSLPDRETYSIQDPYELPTPTPLSTQPWCGTCVRLDNSNTDAWTDPPPQGSNRDERGTSPTLSPPSFPVRGGGRPGPRTSRSVSSSSTRERPIDPYGVTQSWECKQCR